MARISLRRKSTNTPFGVRVDRGVIPHDDNGMCRKAVQSAVRAFVKFYGLKAGLPKAAEAIGISPRVARHAHEGTSFAADAERARRADEARLSLMEKQLEELWSDVDEVERRSNAQATSKAQGSALPVPARAYRALRLWRAVLSRACPRQSIA